MLRSRGLKVGAYTSPHLVDFTERIRVGGAQVPREEVVAFIERWTPDAERIGATFFEFTTALAFDWFARQSVDVAVIETGLGGRLDATNVIRPVVAAVTSIGLDHTDLLGETPVRIATEKAGIFKRGVPAVVGERKPGLARELAGLARAMGAAPVVLAADEFVVSDVAVDAGGTSFTLTVRGRPHLLRTPLIGEYQAWNAATAIAMLDAAGSDYAVAPDRWVSAIRGACLPGRMDRRGSFIFDVAHNASGVAVLIAALARIGVERPLVAVVGILADKDWRAMLDQLVPACDELILTSPASAPAGRRWDPAVAAAHARERGGAVTVVPDLDEALALAEQRGPTVLVTGSFHTVGDAMSCLQLSPIRG